MLKVGFELQDILAMPEAEADGYLEAYSQLVNPPKAKTYMVKRQKQDKRKR